MTNGHKVLRETRKFVTNGLNLEAGQTHDLAIKVFHMKHFNCVVRSLACGFQILQFVTNLCVSQYFVIVRHRHDISTQFTS